MWAWVSETLDMSFMIKERYWYIRCEPIWIDFIFRCLAHVTANVTLHLSQPKAKPWNNNCNVP